MGRPVTWLPCLQVEISAWLKAEASTGDLALRLALDLDAGVLSARLEPLPVTPQPYRLAVLTHPLAQRRADAMVVHKGLAGPWGSGVLATARQLGVEDALLLWADATLAETAIASVGVEIDGVLTLPPAEGRVASLAMNLDLPAWAAARGLRITTAGMPLAQATRGQLWCMNALRGIWPAELL
jgi:branched-subunit amino acid aminotransferase/4-amino-4-deoxychorismate lyase